MLFLIWFENGNGGAVPRQQKKTGGVLTGQPAAANPVRCVWGGGSEAGGGSRTERVCGEYSIDKFAAITRG